jgi:death on curing protein
MNYLTKAFIEKVNFRTVKAHGGNFVPPSNFLHEESLDYLIEAVQAEMFGAPLYPSISDKAGYIFFNIIGNHIFQDGNKRTGLEAALLFLEKNGYQLKDELIQVKNEEKNIPSEIGSVQGILFDFVIEAASGKLNLEDCQTWIAANIEPLNA